VPIVRGNFRLEYRCLKREVLPVSGRSPRVHKQYEPKSGSKSSCVRHSILPIFLPEYLFPKPVLQARTNDFKWLRRTQRRRTDNFQQRRGPNGDLPTFAGDPRRKRTRV